MAPFVKTAVDIDDPEIALSIVNTQCAVQDAVSADSQKQSLRELFEEVRKFYKVLPCENLMTSHGELFDRRFLKQSEIFHQLLKTRSAMCGLLGAVKILLLINAMLT